MVSKNSSKIITLDIETAPRIGLFFGNTYKASIGKVVDESYVFGFSYKPLHKRVRSVYIWDFPLYKKQPKNDIEVVKAWLKLVSETDIVIGQNSRSFDDKIMIGRAIVHSLPPPEPFLTVDTMADTRRVARYDSNKLDDVARQYGFGGKHDTGGIDLWWDCMRGDKKAQRKMVKYCERDVVLTEKRYLRELPYYKNHPSLNVMEERPKACRNCLSEDIVATTKYKPTRTQAYQYHRCNNCGHVMKVRIPEKREKMLYG